MSQSGEKHLFKLTKRQAEAIRAAMTGCDATWWRLIVRTGADWNAKDDNVCTLLGSADEWEQEGVHGFELGLTFHFDATTLGELAMVADVCEVTHVSIRGTHGHILVSEKFYRTTSWANITDLSSLQGLTQLTSLDLSYCGSLTDLTPLQGLTQLTSLHLKGSKDLTDLTPLQGLTQLTSLDLESCHSLTDLTPLQGLTQLTSLKK